MGAINLMHDEIEELENYRERKPKIYLYCIAMPVDVVGYALAEDGKMVASHISSDENWSKHDLGFDSNWHHDEYATHYPNGYELEWVSDLEGHAAFNAAFGLHVEANPVEATTR
jgi:hypothetical protein